MPFNQELKSGYIESNNIDIKRGILRNRTHTSIQNVRPKLTNTVMIPMKPDRRKCQSKILNRKQPDESNLSVKRSSSFTICKQNSQEKPSVRVLEKCVVPNASQVNNFPISNTSSNASMNTKKVTSAFSQTLVGDSVNSILYKMEHLKIDNSIMSDDENLKKDMSKLIKDPAPPKVEKPVEILEMKKSASHPIGETTLINLSSMHDELKIGNNIELVVENQHNYALLESELKAYNEHLRKYDQEAKYVIEKFTVSLEEKGKIIRQYEEDLSVFNSRVRSLQRELEQSLERTRQLESTVKMTNCLQFNVDPPPNDLQSENEELKQVITNLKTKLAKRDLHICNLKQVLGLETNKIKQLNNAQEEIIILQRESIDKSQQINMLREQLKYETHMRSELIHEYDEKISKLKKLLAIREFLLIEERNS